jgi:hypothetical protein
MSTSGGDRLDHARAPIENCLAAFSFAYDRGELDELTGCFTADVLVEYYDIGAIRGRDAVLAEFGRRRALYPAGHTPWHQITNLHLRAAENGAVLARSFVTFIVHRRDAEPTAPVLAWYEDVFVQERGQWRISERRMPAP